ncbi:MAG TPA: response regulator [Streptosporangiaceae bacterium]|nr:response regulator [Streptosporangiaceae bacterium]
MRCVIVDDNRDFLRIARGLLTYDGIVVAGAVSTGEQARRACRELEPDVVLIDIDLGDDETGIEVARQLPGRQAGAEQPSVILISAYSGDDFEDLIADSPAISFLPKASLSGAAIRDILAQAGRPGR